MAFPSRIPNDELHYLYYDKQLTHKEIGQIFGLTRGAVQRRMKFLGWPTIPKVERSNHGKPEGESWQILLGCIMGDGHIFKPKVNARLELKHSVKQEEYLNWKINKLSPWVDFYYKKIQSSKIGADVIHAVSFCYPWLTGLHEQLYNHDGTRRIDASVFAQMDELAFAVWYLDDGSYNTVRNNDYVVLSSMRYGKNGNERISDWLYRKWGFTPNIYRHPSRPEAFAYSLQFNLVEQEVSRL